MTTAVLWATWLTAGGTILAALVPGVLWFFERRDRKAAQDEVHRLRDEEAKAQEERVANEREAERTRQARGVFVWSRWDLDSGGPIEGVWMHNGSDLPVFDVMLIGYTHRRGTIFWEEKDGYREAVLPGKGFAAGGTDMLQPKVWVLFLDAKGVSWARDSEGNLTENPDREEMMKPHPLQEAANEPDG